METDRHRRFTVLRSTAAAAALLIVTVAHVAHAPPASACTCAYALGEGPDLAEEFAEAAAVFVGEVLDYSTRRQSDGSLYDPALWLFRVEHVYKGSVAEQQGVVSAVMDGKSCGLVLPRTGRVLVFAERPSERSSIDGADLYAHGCSRSGAIESLEVSALSAILGDPVPPRPGVGGPVTLNEPGGRARTIVAAALTLAGMFLLAAGARRKWRVARRSRVER